MGKSNSNSSTPTQAKKKRAYLSQSEVPSLTLDEATRVPQAIADNYASHPVTPLQLATALDMTPTSSKFRMLCGASIAYGLTSGGYNAAQITMESLGKRITAPTVEHDDLAAKREAILQPRVSREFLQKYDGAAIPKHNIALNVLVELGVPKEKAEPVFDMVMNSARSVDIIRKLKGKEFVDLTGVRRVDINDEPESDDTADIVDFPTPDQAETEHESDDTPIIEPTIVPDERLKRVFITHGKNKAFLDLIKKLLGYGELTAVISVDKQTVSKPVPDKVMDDMRGCGAAIIHVEAEKKLIDKEANEHTMINENVLIEIGAAMALYGKRFILLVEDGVKLPSNLQGLFEVRYSGNNLDGETTMKLLDAINDIKNQSLPTR